MYFCRSFWVVIVSNEATIKIEDALLRNFKSNLRSGFEKYRFEHKALPEINFSDIDTSVKFLGRELSIPLIIYPIVGNSEKSEKINRGLSELANDYRLGFVVGDQRADIENRHHSRFRKIRSIAPKMLLLANLPAIQLNYGFSLDECREAVESIDADGLMLFLNPLHEVFQPDGKHDFSGLLKKIEKICSKLEAPVIVKEVGYGISPSIAKQLYDSGVYAIDIAGAGSISWLEVEEKKFLDVVVRDVARSFSSWGNPTAECLEAISGKNLKIISSGGIKTGIDIAKSIALGASLCGNATEFLRHSLISRAECENLVEFIALELKITMFCVGCKNIQELRSAKLIKTQ